MLLTLCACSYTPPGEVSGAGDDQPAPDGGDNDGGMSTGDQAGCTPFVFGDVCGLTPGNPLVISAVDNLDTGDDPRCTTFSQSAGSDACLVYRSQISIESTGALIVSGSRPLLLVSSSTITIDGKLDGASHFVGGRGPSANEAGCMHAATPEADGGGGGGGAGGSFAATGGNGGIGDTDTSSGSAGNGAAGLAGSSVAAPAFLRGGCGGQRGGNGDVGENGGEPGASGGAIGLLAVTSVTISSGITINGAGGEGGDTQSGGGGGGSGGMLVVESALIDHSGVIVANGGGGGEGGNRNNGIDIAGNPGSDGAVAAAAPGGSGATPFGGPGGAGSFGGTLGGATGANSLVGGGGGGGAAGYLVFVGTRTGAGTTSPAVTQQ